MGTGLLQPTHLIFLILVLGILSVPAYIVGSRLRVQQPGLAFIPFVGAWIVILRSARINAWLTILAVIPYVNFVFGIWAAFKIPSRHGRSTAWGICFIIPLVNLIGFWVYAFTLESGSVPPSEGIAQPADSSSSADSIEQLRRLSALRDEGILTHEEFEQKKAELLVRV
jgi:hypothetical protein